ncbi:MAG: plastocyanin/azurin family copper-binding protein [Planctomycetota bacterium]
MISKALLTLATGLLASASLSAQTTHFVDNGPTFDFIPKDITIQVGDTVTWVWKGGVHTVDSSVSGIPDGIFSSGVTGDVGFEFSVTFDQAFLLANPVPGGVYEYLCIIHAAFGQDGTVTVQQAPIANPYGCVNPSASLTTISGQPRVGGTWVVGVDNPLGTQPAGSLAFLSASTVSAPGFPCGLVLPGFGMSGAGANGELLIDLTAPNPILSLGPVAWDGANPASIPVAFPNNPQLVGFPLFFQGLMFDAGGTSGITFGATEGLAVTVGS